jgi:hypothetical protein
MVALAARIAKGILESGESQPAIVQALPQMIAELIG